MSEAERPVTALEARAEMAADDRAPTWAVPSLPMTLPRSAALRVLSWAEVRPLTWPEESVPSWVPKLSSWAVERAAI